MKSSTSHNPLDSDIPKHSPRFDEWEVLLPKYIDNPMLKDLALRLQASMLTEDNTDTAQPNEITKVKLEYEANKRSSANSEQVQALNDCQNNKELEAQLSKKLTDKMLDTQNANAAVLVIITNEPVPKMLLTRRSGKLNTHAGEVSFAGGKHDAGDGNNVVTALREACEETALPPSKAKLIGQLPLQTSKFGLSVRPIVALVDPNITYVPELGEIERLFWADLQVLVEQPTVEYERPYEYEGQQITFLTPSWVVDGERVWGLTGRILVSFLNICFDRHVEWYYRPKL